MKNKFDIIILGILLGIFFILFSSEIRLIRIESNIKSIKEYLEPPLPDFDFNESH